MDLDGKIRRYREAAVKGVRFQIKHQQPDGGYIWEGYANNAYHKQAYSWAMSGYYGEAHRLLNWARTDRLQPDGQLQAGAVGEMARIFAGQIIGSMGGWLAEPERGGGPLFYIGTHVIYQVLDVVTGVEVQR